MRRKPPLLSIVATATLLALVSGPAHAFRCGSKIVDEKMHEAEVRRACGAPTTMRQIGRTLRNVNVPIESDFGGWKRQRLSGYYFAQEVVVTEYVYNFGPRKLMFRSKLLATVIESK